MKQEISQPIVEYLHSGGYSNAYIDSHKIGYDYLYSFTSLSALLALACYVIAYYVLEYYIELGDKALLKIINLSDIVVFNNGTLYLNDGDPVFRKGHFDPNDRMTFKSNFNYNPNVLSGIIFFGIASNLKKAIK